MTAQELTELEKLRGELESSRRRIDALIAATSEIVWYADAKQKSGSSHGWTAFTGNAKAAAKPSGWLESVHPDDRAAILTEADRGMGRRTPYVNEYRLAHHGGGWRWVEDRAVPVLDDDGAVIEWVGVISDIDDRKTAEKALRDSEERFRLAMMASEVGVWDVDLRTGTRTWSDELKSILGLSQDALPSEEALRASVYFPDRALIEEAHNETFLQRSGPGSVLFRIVRADNGEVRWILSRGRALFDTSGTPVRRLGTFQDVTERRRLELDLHEGERRLNSALRAGRMVAWERDAETGAVNRSENAEEILGLSSGRASEFLARVPAEDHHAAAWDPDVGALPASGVAQFRYRHPDGRQLWMETRADVITDETGRRRVVGLTSDITERKIAEAALVHAANHDPLTGLLNRMAFSLQLERALGQAASAGRSLQVLFLDVDSLKTINDCLGHDAGDAVIIATGRHLEAMSPPFGFVARLSGDEFAAVLSGDDLNGAERLAEQLISNISAPLLHKGRSLNVSASIGLGSYPVHGAEPGSLMKAADLALYAAKQSGKNRARWFEPEMRASLEERTALKAQMSAALAAGQIVPYYQPKLDLITGCVVGFEALARWRHPTHGLLTPAAFGSLFEDGEMALAIGIAMSDQVLGDLRGWLAKDLAIGRVSINCSSHDFRASGFGDAILDRLAASGVPPAHFEVEVTEGVILSRDGDAVALVLERLHRAGIKISLDDFGTGYASLVHLQKFPVDEIKLDRSFVGKMELEPNRAIIKAMVTLGESLGLTIVAEGVETFEQAAVLREMGCHRAQGFLFGKPMSAGRVPWFMGQHAKRALGFQLDTHLKRASGS